MKKVPVRRCLGCMESKPKKELCRVVKAKDGTVTLDNTGKMEGRGAYICFNEECLEKAIKSRRLQKEFEMQIDNQLFEELRERIINAK